MPSPSGNRRGSRDPQSIYSTLFLPEEHNSARGLFWVSNCSFTTTHINSFQPPARQVSSPQSTNEETESGEVNYPRTHNDEPQKWFKPVTCHSKAQIHNNQTAQLRQEAEEANIWAHSAQYNSLNPSLACRLQWSQMRQVPKRLLLSFLQKPLAVGQPLASHLPFTSSGNAGQDRHSRYKKPQGSKMTAELILVLCG